MIIKDIIDEDFVNYKKPSMYIAFPYCKLKCDIDCGKPVCQNSPLLYQPDIEISYDDLIQRYLNNPITEAIVCSGLDPCDSPDDIVNLIMFLRIKYHCEDDVIIYTGYNRNEISWLIDQIKWLKNIIVKCGRYIPGQMSHYDEVLGVNLASDNQYAEKIG